MRLKAGNGLRGTRDTALETGDLVIDGCVAGTLPVAPRRVAGGGKSDQCDKKRKPCERIARTLPLRLVRYCGLINRCFLFFDSRFLLCNIGFLIFSR